MRSPYFRERISKKAINQLSIENEDHHPIDADLFRLILEYIYSDKCPWLNLVHRIRVRDENEYQAHLARMKANEDEDIDDHRYFARVRQQTASTSGAHSHQHGSKSKKKKKTGSYFFVNVHVAHLSLCLFRSHVAIARIYSGATGQWRGVEQWIRPLASAVEVIAIAQPSEKVRWCQRMRSKGRLFYLDWKQSNRVVRKISTRRKHPLVQSNSVIITLEKPCEWNLPSSAMVHQRTARF